MNSIYKLVWINITPAKSKNNFYTIITIIIQFNLNSLFNYYKYKSSENKKNHPIEVYN